MQEIQVSSDPSRPKTRVIGTVIERRGKRAFDFNSIAMTTLPCRLLLGAEAEVKVCHRGFRFDQGVFEWVSNLHYARIRGFSNIDIVDHLEGCPGLDPRGFPMDARVAFIMDPGFTDRLTRCWQEWLWMDPRSPFAVEAREMRKQHLRQTNGSPTSISGIPIEVSGNLSARIRSYAMPDFIDFRLQ